MLSGRLLNATAGCHKGDEERLGKTDSLTAPVFNNVTRNVQSPLDA
jgi:hypothetical protein